MTKFDGSVGDALPDLMADSPLGDGFFTTAAEALAVRIALVARETLKKTSRFWQNTRIPPAEFPHEADDLR